MPAPRVNWEAIKAEYIAGDESVTQRSIAAKYGVNFATVGKRASKERWAEARAAYRQQVASKTLGRVSTTEAELRAKQMRVSDALLSKGLTAMQQLNPTTYSEALRTVETALEQARKAAGLPEESTVHLPDLQHFTDEELVAAREKLAELKRRMASRD